MKVILNIVILSMILVSCGEDRKPRRGTAKAKKEAAKKMSKPLTDSKEVKAPVEKPNVVEMKKPQSKEDPIPKDQLAFAEKLIKDTKSSEVNGVDAAKKFKMSCAICHGRKGDMSINGAKILKDTKTSLAHRVAQVYFGKGTMTPFKGILKDHEIIAVSSYIDELKK